MGKGVVLSEALAVEIYKCKFQGAGKQAKPVRRGRSSAVARMFDISPKTVRDIWNHVSWKYATYPFWPSAPIQDLPAESSSEKVRVIAY
jgi:hypothetical protein